MRTKNLPWTHLEAYWRNRESRLFIYDYSTIIANSQWNEIHLLLKFSDVGTFWAQFTRQNVDQTDFYTQTNALSAFVSISAQLSMRYTAALRFEMDRLCSWISTKIRCSTLSTISEEHFRWFNQVRPCDFFHLNHRKRAIEHRKNG